MTVKRGKVELRILEDCILVNTTSLDEKPSVIGVAPQEGRTIWNALQSIIRNIDALPPLYVIEAIRIIFDKSMAPEVLKSLKQIRSKLKSQNVKTLIAELIDRLEKLLSGPKFDPTHN